MGGEEWGLIKAENWGRGREGNTYERGFFFSFEVGEINEVIRKNHRGREN